MKSNIEEKRLTATEAVNTIATILDNDGQKT